jgi:hypothetical protein
MVVIRNDSAELAALGQRLKRAGGPGGLRPALIGGLRSAAAPLVPAVKDAARSQLPKSGGLNEQVAGQDVKVTVRLTGKAAGVRLTTTAPDTKQTDSGYVRHPVFGKKPWVRQEIPAAKGWWSGTLARKGPAVTAELKAVQAAITVEIMARFKA